MFQPFWMIHVTQFHKCSNLDGFGLRFFPLLSKISTMDDDGQWWLLDSGASSTVMASRFVEVYGVKVKQQRDGSKFRAANGSVL